MIEDKKNSSGITDDTILQSQVVKLCESEDGEFSIWSS